MYIPKDAIVAGLLGLAKVSSGMPTTNTSTPALPDSINSTVPVINSTAPVIVPELVNGTEPVFTNDTHGIANDTDVIVNDTQLMSWLSAPKQKHHSLFKRGLPPRDRKLADHMENYGENLPECYKKCMRSEDGKSSIHMGQDTLGQICGVKWPLFMWWTEHHLVYCVNGKHGCKGDRPHQEAFNWLKATCGDKPN